MALELKPHEVSVWRAVPTLVAGRITGYARVEVASFFAMVCGRSARDVEVEFGMESKCPAVLLTDVGDGGGIKVGDHVHWGVDRFVVRSDAAVFNADVATSHAKFLMEKLD